MGSQPMSHPSSGSTISLPDRQGYGCFRSATGRNSATFSCSGQTSHCQNASTTHRQGPRSGATSTVRPNCPPRKIGFWFWNALTPNSDPPHKSSNQARTDEYPTRLRRVNTGSNSVRIGCCIDICSRNGPSYSRDRTSIFDQATSSVRFLASERERDFQHSRICGTYYS